MAVEPAAFKHAFGHHPAGVAVISAAGPDGPAGLTVSSVASVSVNPPALLFSLSTSRGSASKILAADSFVVNLLGADQLPIAQSFAKPGAPRFTTEQGWSTLPTGEPVLSGVHAALRCTPFEKVAIGDSTCIVARVEDVVVDAAGDPLVYMDRGFYTLDAEHVIG
ncbi:flavin reductase family protein [Brevibacterium sp. 50QC2O2]|uniref:flavin reductase family protein n=1 Tax=unclassified Brevibacterium TaxID=2614124 RepID=UPI00211CE0A6|nr:MULTISPECIES: flavin reductase family protein [unclassified Brevibacterium]MCQ9366977.1 flavin reductase family protein [Brevibacterium sp. 91QC2O2]MCQ9388396.1 flavin reductase family protein [Brevibacterium sp. 50QC2O2]